MRIRLYRVPVGGSGDQTRHVLYRPGGEKAVVRVDMSRVTEEHYAKPGEALLQAPSQNGRATGDPLPRSQAHVRHTAARTGRPPQDRPGTPRARHHCHDVRHLLSLPALDGRPGVWSDGRRLRLAASLTGNCQEGQERTPGPFLCC